MDNNEARHAALISFRLLYATYNRAIDEGAAYAGPAAPGYRGHTIEVGGVPYRLCEKEAGSLDARLQNEDALIRKDWNERCQLSALVKALAAENKILTESNAGLRELLGSPSESVTTVERDPTTLEMTSTRTLKRNL